ncbi:MAG: patatin-like phospholipase family protein [Paracoccaceae bacterium]
MAAEPVFVVFEGGGAKGVAHLGALAALEAAEDAGAIRVRGYAGTSAGAIVAALAASGWRSHEIVSREDRTDILRRLGRKYGTPERRATDLLGTEGWRAVRRLRDLGRLRLWLPIYGSVVLTTCAVLYGLIVAPPIPADWLIGVLAALTLVVAGLGWRLGLARALDLTRGFANLDGLVRLLNTALADKLNIPTDQQVTFADIAARTRLKIVASDLEAGHVRLFPDRPADEEIPVAVAVAASACIPFVFGAQRIGERYHVDGGLISNLPAWAFDYELRLEEEASVLAFQIQDGGPSASVLVRLLRTAVFGGKPMALRNIPQLVTGPLPSRLGVLDFDASFETICQEIDEARCRARDLMVPLTEYPARFEGLAARARDLFGEYVSEVQVRLGAERYGGTVRASFAVPFGEPVIGLRHRYSAGYEDTADARLALPLKNSICGAAYARPETGGIAIADLRQPLRDDVSLSWPEYRIAKNRAAAVTLSFVAAIRIEIPNLVGGVAEAYVLQIDGTEPVDLSPDTLRAILVLVRREILAELDGLA